MGSAAPDRLLGLLLRLIAVEAVVFTDTSCSRTGTCLRGAVRPDVGLEGLKLKIVDVADQNFMYVSSLDAGIIDPNVLGREARVGIRGEEFEVRNSYEDGDHIYLRLDREHGAGIGDIVSLVKAAPTDPGAYVPASMKPSEFADRPQYNATIWDDARELLRNEKFSEATGLTAATNLFQVQAEVHDAQRPALVFVTQPWCGASSYLKDSVKDSVATSEDLRMLLRRFVVAHAVSTVAEWQVPGSSVNETYTPRAYFMSTSGQILDVRGPDPTYPRYFQDAKVLEAALREVLDEHGQN